MIYLILFFLIPIILEQLAPRFKIIQHLGVVTFCYMAGVIIGNIPGVKLPEEMLISVIEILVPLSIPLLLYKSDWGIWKKGGLKMLIAFLLGVVSVVIACVISFSIFKDQIMEAREYTAMMSGIYTGGTMNMSSIGISLGVTNESFIILNMAEMLMGGIWLLFLLALAKPLFVKFLPQEIKITETKKGEEFDDQMYWPGSLWSFLWTIVLVGVTVGLSMLIFGGTDELFIILMVTTLGIASSAIPAVQKWKGSFGLGNYFLNVFCVGIGSLASIQKLLATNPQILLFVLCIMLITVILHLIFSKIFKIGVDTFIMSSTAGLYGPPFIAPVAKAINNPSIIPIGLATAIFGLAIGNYCGILLYRLLGYV